MIIDVISNVPDDDLRVMVDRDNRCGADTRMIDIVTRLVGVGSVVLLEPTTVGREGGEGCPRTIFREWVFRADEAGGCDRPVGDRYGRHEHNDGQTDWKAAK